ncbi:hypothetical protein HDA40_008148 [Hamadaea flava]|uniref:Uncharacterized protein n=1 Tax=Hamadaea flava TaxID=1742688 RepID=A0ABV8LNF0_9ACTN|nr:hypothetical protein [Hamadaea flava]MCP2329641.1 hypothetical protein [Hamadaea flava]
MSTRPVARRSVLIGAVALAPATYLPRAVTGPAVRWGNPVTGLTGTIPVGTYG